MTTENQMDIFRSLSATLLALYKVPNELVRIAENWGQGCQKLMNK